MAFRKKAGPILAHSPDILVVQECEHPSKINFPDNEVQPTDILWFGKNLHKGLAIFSFSHYRFRLLPIHKKDFKTIVPVAVTGGKTDFNLFAIWANNPLDPEGHYVTQIWKAVHYYEALFKKPAILTGDFNSNTIWDHKNGRPGDHSGLVRFLAAKNIFSTYHSYHRHAHGKEAHPTLYMYRHRSKPYHIDYCFASASILKKLRSVEVGAYREWSKYSDHAPLIVTFDLPDKQKKKSRKINHG